jgi:hypothetical protein
MFNSYDPNWRSKRKTSPHEKIDPEEEYLSKLKAEFEGGKRINDLCGPMGYSNHSNPLIYCAERDYLKCARWLLKNGFYHSAPIKHGYTPLHFCASKEMAELLLSAGADQYRLAGLRKSESGGKTAHEYKSLLLKLKEDSSEILQLHQIMQVMEKGVDIDEKVAVWYLRNEKSS